MKKIIYGIHVVQSYIESNADIIENVYTIKKDSINYKIKKIKEICDLKKIPFHFMNSKNFSKVLIHPDKKIVHQGVMATCKKNIYTSEDDFNNFIKSKNKISTILIIDGIQDPRNLGACIRTANAAGVQYVIFQKNRTVKVNSTVEKVASGTINYMKLVSVNNLARTIKFIKKYGIWTIGLTEKGNISLYEVNFSMSSFAMIIGSEDKGLRKETEKICDYVVKIPTYGNINSLNVSVANGIALFEIIRQNNFKKI